MGRQAAALVGCGKIMGGVVEIWSGGRIFGGAKKLDMRVIFLLSAMLLMLVGCVSFKDRNGKRFRQYALATDYSKQYFASHSEQSIEDFDANKIGTTDTTSAIVYFSPSDFERLKSKYPYFIVLFWNSTCRGARTDSLAAKIEAKGMPVILVSFSYGHEIAKKKFSESKLKNRNFYVMNPSQKTDKSIVKILYFMKEACDSCYVAYQDELLYSSGLEYNNGCTTALFFKELNAIKEGL